MGICEICGTKKSKSVRHPMNKSFDELFFLDDPIADGALGAVKADAYFYQTFAVGMIREHVALLIYLGQCLLGTLVYLQFEDVDCIWHVHHGISPAYGTLHLRLNIVSQQDIYLLFLPYSYMLYVLRC